jgi:hypothetical protein
VGGKLGLGGWGSVHRRTKMHQVYFSVMVCVERESARFSGAEVSSEQAEAEESCGGVGRARQTHGGASADKRGTPGAEVPLPPGFRASGWASDTGSLSTASPEMKRASAQRY